MTKKALFIATLLCLAACSKKPTLLPDGGPTTEDIWRGNTTARATVTSAAVQGGYPIAALPVTTVKGAQVPSTISGSHLDELNQDFKEVPNPKILGYVYPHYSATGMPVPGYFTSFRLYKVNHNALMGEGAIGELP